MPHPEVRHFYGDAVVVKLANYSNSRIAIQLIAISDGDTYMTASINLPKEPLAPDEVAIKDDSMLEWLIAERIVSEPVWYALHDLANVPICKIRNSTEWKERIK